MKQPNLAVESYGTPDIDSLESVFFTTLYKRMSELKQGAVANEDLSSSLGSVNESECSVNGTQAAEQDTIVAKG